MNHIPTVRQYFIDYIENALGMNVGQQTLTYQDKKTYDLKEGEEWTKVNKRWCVLSKKIEGPANTYDYRELANILFINNMEKALFPFINHIYFAGGCHTPRINIIKNRLFSFYDIGMVGNKDIKREMR